MVLSKEEKQFFLNNGYLILKNILPNTYVNNNINDCKEILKKNNYKFNSEICYDNSFLRLNFGDSNLSNKKKIYEKRIFKKLYDVFDEIISSKKSKNKYSISGLDNRLFIGLKSKILEKKDVHDSYWHIDGWNNYHYLNVQKNALIFLCSFCDLEGEGGTLIIPKSIKYITELLFNNEQGLHSDGLGGYSYIIPYILNKCSNKDIIQLKINKGDVVVMHPFMVHKASLNNSNITKIINNNHIQLSKPINLKREDNDYSLLEKSILKNLKELNLDIKNYKESDTRKTVIPPPGRNSETKNKEINNLMEEMKLLKLKNIITPNWVTDEHNYLDNKIINKEKIINKIIRYSYNKRK